MGIQLKLIHRTEDLDTDVSVYMNDTNGQFVVIYGSDVTQHEDSLSAFTQYGTCLRHSAECAGLLDGWEAGS